MSMCVSVCVKKEKRIEKIKNEWKEIRDQNFLETIGYYAQGHAGLRVFYKSSIINPIYISKFLKILLRYPSIYIS